MQTDPHIRKVSWSEFLKEFDWRQGEHVSLIGPTGCGKTTLALAILPRRTYTVAFGSKPKDDTLPELIKRGWRKLEKWTPRPYERRIVLWPKFDKPEQVANQRRVFQKAFEEIFTAGNWCVYVDEARYFNDVLKLSAYLRLYWYQGRSLGISLVTTTQRPAYMPLEMYDAATHLFLWRETDRVNLTRLGGIAASPAGGIDHKVIAQTVASLPLHECLYVNTRSGQTLRTIVTEEK